MCEIPILQIGISRIISWRSQPGARGGDPLVPYFCPKILILFGLVLAFRGKILQGKDLDLKVLIRWDLAQGFPTYGNGWLRSPACGPGRGGLRSLFSFYSYSIKPGGFTRPSRGGCILLEIMGLADVLSRKALDKIWSRYRGPLAELSVPDQATLLFMTALAVVLAYLEIRSKAAPWLGTVAV